jgi:hypothetical protein
MVAPVPASEEMDHCHAAVLAWHALGELRIAEIADPSETGSRYEILKVAAIVVDRRALTVGHRATRPGVKVRATNRHEKRSTDGDDFVAVDASRVVLPTATAWTVAGPITYRLPPTLAAWVLTNIAITSAGTDVFPSAVEFCKLNGKYTANFA